MLVTVRGTYQDGIVRLSEPVPASAEAGQVIVTFLPAPESPPPARPRFSFDEALALPTIPGTSVSDAVIEEREAERL